jgi:hypothetical protein
LRVGQSMIQDTYHDRSGDGNGLTSRRHRMLNR